MLLPTLSFAAVVSVDMGSGSYSLRDQNGVALTRGSAGVNGDGALIYLGFYTDGTTSNPFGTSSTSDSNFVALTGLGNIFGSPNTTIGDQAANLPNAGEFFISGLLINDTNPNAASLPAAGTPLVMRILSGQTVGSSQFKMEFSNPSLWKWISPTVPAPSINIDLDDANLRLLTNQVTRASQVLPTGVGGPINANVALIPEPSTLSFGVISVLTLLGSRRRRREVAA